MATTSIALVKDKWSEIATSACRFQNKSSMPIYASEKPSLPSTLVDYVIIEPLEIYYYDALGGNLYGYSPGRDSEIVIS